MNWRVEYLSEVERDLKKLGHTQRLLIQKAIKKISQNPLPVSEGGYGKPLGNKAGMNLTGLYKVKLRGEGLRIVYKVIRQNKTMIVLVVGVREDDEVYHIAQNRIDQ